MGEKKLPPNIILVGLMGCGKSSVGRFLAGKTGFSFEDLDVRVEQLAGCDISSIFEKRGEKAFRELEQKAVREWLGSRRTILALGGGTFTDESNRKELLRSGWCAWLKVSPEEAWRRIQKGKGRFQRPLLHGKENPVQILTDLLEERCFFYAQAHAHFITDGKSPESVGEEMLRFLRREAPFDLSVL